MVKSFAMRVEAVAMLLSVSSACTSVRAAMYDGVDVAAGDLHARDLTPLKNVRPCPGAPIVVVKDGVCRLPIIYRGKRDMRRAAIELACTIEEMTGAKAEIIVEGENPVTNAPAFYIGDTSAAAKAGLAAPTDHVQAFRVVMRNGSVFFLGKQADFAVFDWSERQLDVRYYWANRYKPKRDGFGKCVSRTRGLAVRPVDYDDRPVFEIRENWPYEEELWNLYGKGGGFPRQLVHQPARWYREPDATNRLDIFQLTAEGERAESPMLCYGNPKTLEYYKQRIEEEFAGGRKSSVVVKNQKAISVSQWDAGISCCCEYCKRLVKPELGSSGSASPIIWGYFTKELAKWMKEKHPDYLISILPYINTRDVPPGLDFNPEGNVEAEVTMAALAMYKNPNIKADDEAYMRDWKRVTGRPVVTWHYSCWPGQFTSAPFLFGEIIRKHYEDTRDCQIGTFINGGFDASRFSLSMYVWMRSMWNPDFDVQAVYDEFCRRMFGRGAKPMRKLLQMQEEGWSRPWKSDQCTDKNIYVIAYPRKDVVRMEQLLDEAQTLAADDELSVQRILKYRSGFARFFKESEEHEKGTAFEPFIIHKAVANPICDGKLDEACWDQCEDRRLERAFRKPTDPQIYSSITSVVKAVWFPNKGVTFGFWFYEPATEVMRRVTTSHTWRSDNFEIFIDPSGTGDGHFLQLFLYSKGGFMARSFGAVKWNGEGVKSAVHIDKGWWSAEVFVPFDSLRVYPSAQLPNTSANGLCWTGNINRWRVGDAYTKKTKEEQEMCTSHQRLNTRFSPYNRDPSAFSTWKFVELDGNLKK